MYLIISSRNRTDQDGVGRGLPAQSLDGVLAVVVGDEGVPSLRHVTHGLHLDGLSRARLYPIVIGINLD